MERGIKLRTVIIVVVSAVIAIALIVTNIYVPVKYLFSYTVLRDGRAGEGVMRVKFVDVGYGDCIIVELPDGKNMVIDGGNGSGTNEARILKLLNKSGIDNIDYLVCTSVNGEQCGGLAEIIRYKNVGKVYSAYCKNIYVTEEYASFISALNVNKITATVIEKGLTVHSEAGYKFTFLSPSALNNPEGEYAQLGKDPENQTLRDNASAVMWLEYAGTSFMFTSDAGKQALSKLCADYETAPESFKAELEKCSVMTVPAHGSGKNICGELYRLASPEAVILSVGKNGYGCPGAECISVLADNGFTVKRTDEDKTVTVEVTQDGFTFI